MQACRAVRALLHALVSDQLTTQVDAASQSAARCLQPELAPSGASREAVSLTRRQATLSAVSVRTGWCPYGVEPMPEVAVRHKRNVEQAF